MLTVRLVGAVVSILMAAIPVLPQQKVEKSGAAQSGAVRFIEPPGLTINPRYSHVVEINRGRIVLISGQVAFDKDGKLVGKGDMRAQTAKVFENLQAALNSVGATFNDVVKLNSFLVDMPANIAAYREVRAKYLAQNQHPPASTTVGVAALVEPELLLEVEAEVVLPESRK